MPQAIVRALPREGAPSYAQAIQVQSALAIAILTTAPMRVKNLASLRLGRHVVQTRPGGVRHIVIPAEEVKNDTPLTFEVSDALGAVMDIYLARCRPLLSEDPEGFLFPAREEARRRRAPSQSRSSAHSGRRRESISTPMPSAISRPSCFWPSIQANTRRSGYFWVTKTSTRPIKFYCGLEQADALRRYDALIDRYRKEEPA